LGNCAWPLNGEKGFSNRCALPGCPPPNREGTVAVAFGVIGKGSLQATVANLKQEAE
jgi:hypothetical protein